MEHKRFTELLNLYLDDEISPDEMSAMRAELGRDPARQALFDEYCRINKACKLLGGKFGVEPRCGRSFRRMAYAFGGLAAAFVLLAMAGRNLVPLFEGTSEATIVQRDASAGASIPEFLAAETLSIAESPPKDPFVIRPASLGNASNLKLREIDGAPMRVNLTLMPTDPIVPAYEASPMAEGVIEFRPFSLEDVFGDGGQAEFSRMGVSNVSRRISVSPYRLFSDRQASR